MFHKHFDRVSEAVEIGKKIIERKNIIFIVHVAKSLW